MISTARWTARARRAALGAGLAAALTVAAAAPAAAATDTTATTSQAQAAAHWLVGQLADGDHVETTFGGQTYPDQGSTADVVLALTSTGSQEAAADAALGWLTTPANVSAYVGSGPEQYAGSHAKLALTVLARGGDPTSVGGVDLIAGLTALEVRSGTDRGRFSDKSAYGDYSNTITQSLALITLERATPGGPSAEAVGFLADQACADGGFPSAFAADPASCASDPDATAFAAQALVAADSDAAAQEALDWLRTHRGADGSWSSAANGAAVPNSNSTGLAAQALSSVGEDTSVSRGYLVSLQKATGADKGGIAYEAGGPADVRATAQAVPALAEVSLLDVAVDPNAEPGPTPAPTPTKTAAPLPTRTTRPSAQPTPETSVQAVAIRDNDLTRGGTELAATGATSPVLAGSGVLLLLAGAGLLVLTRSRHARPGGRS